MAYWLLKTEPEAYSYDDLVREKTGVWDGVRNPTALRNMQRMRRGDTAFIYHTGKERAVVGTAEVVSDPYPDRKSNDPKLTVVELQPRGKLSHPVTLAEIKALPEFQNWELVRISRLSVMPVEPAHWQRVLAMAGGERP